MGGRGAASGMSDNGKAYGSEYSTVYQSENIKFVHYNESTSAKTPMETQTKGRVYVTVNSENELKAITYYDKDNKRNKQIDLDKSHNGLLPHTHHGYEHNENDSKKGAAKLTTEEKTMVDKVKKLWYTYMTGK